MRPLVGHDSTPNRKKRHQIVAEKRTRFDGRKTDTCLLSNSRAKKRPRFGGRKKDANRGRENADIGRFSALERTTFFPKAIQFIIIVKVCFGKCVQKMCTESASAVARDTLVGFLPGNRLRGPRVNLSVAHCRFHDLGNSSVARNDLLHYLPTVSLVGCRGRWV